MLDISQRDGFVLLDIVARPRSDNFGVDIRGNEVRVHLQAPADKGKANAELEKNLKKLFGHPVEIISGMKSKRKTVKVYDATAEEIEKILQSAK